MPRRSRWSSTSGRPRPACRWSWQSTAAGTGRPTTAGDQGRCQSGGDSAGFRRRRGAPADGVQLPSLSSPGRGRAAGLSPPAHKLNVAVTGLRKQYAPGQKVELSLSVTNEKGQPAPATLDVAVADNALARAAENRVASLPTPLLLTGEILRPLDLAGQKKVGGQRRRAIPAAFGSALSTTATPSVAGTGWPFSLVTDSDKSTFSPGAYRCGAPSRQRSTCVPAGDKPAARPRPSAGKSCSCTRSAGSRRRLRDPGKSPPDWRPALVASGCCPTCTPRQYAATTKGKPALAARMLNSKACPPRTRPPRWSAPDRDAKPTSGNIGWSLMPLGLVIFSRYVSPARGVKLKTPMPPMVVCTAATSSSRPPPPCSWRRSHRIAGSAVPANCGPTK